MQTLTQVSAGIGIDAELTRAVQTSIDNPRPLITRGSRDWDQIRDDAFAAYAEKHLADALESLLDLDLLDREGHRKWAEEVRGAVQQEIGGAAWMLENVRAGM